MRRPVPERDHVGIDKTPDPLLPSGAGTSDGPSHRDSGRRPPRPAPDSTDGHAARRRSRFEGRGPWRRNQGDRMIAGVAGGIARRFDIDATVVRIVFVIVTLAAGWGLPLYIGAWLVLPLDGHDESIGSRVIRDRQGVVLALAFLPALIVVTAIGAALRLSIVSSLAWPLFLCCAGGVLLWRNSDQAERAWLRDAATSLASVGNRTSHSWRRLGIRVALGAALLAVGLFWLLVRHGQPAGTTRPVEGALVVAAAVVVLFGPWWLSLVRDLVSERQARQRAEYRADMAARVHDSVLQTLALIQRAADDPQRVVQLARSEQRALRAWLFEGEVTSAVGDKAKTLAAGTELVASEVEDRYGVPVEVVTVGDCSLDEGLRALLDAAREATVNAAKWSGAETISLFAEVEPGRASLFVRDRGCGFDPDEVDSDHHGIAESIRARMLRHGGSAEIRTAPGDGTEVVLVMPRTLTR